MYLSTHVHLHIVFFYTLTYIDIYYIIYICVCVCLCVFVTAQLFRALLSSSLLNTIAAAQAHQKQPWRSHSNAVRRHWAAKQNRTTCAAATLSNTGAATPTRFCKEACKVNVPVFDSMWTMSWSALVKISPLFCGSKINTTNGWLDTGGDPGSLVLDRSAAPNERGRGGGQCTSSFSSAHQMPKRLRFQSGPWNFDVKPAWARPKHNWLTWQQRWAEHSSSPSGSGPCSVGRTRKSRCDGPWGRLYSPSRASQLLAETRQFPAKNWYQRRRQTLQDPGHWLSKSTRA